MPRPLAFAAFVAALLPAQQAMAEQRRPAPQEPAITVEGDRIVCRQITRTATRMRQGRICRRSAEWSSHPDGAASAESYDDIGDAYIKASGTFEPCPYDNGGSPQTPLGPR